MRWRTVPAEALAWRLFEDQLVVRNARTGSTHLLEPFPAAVFLALAQAAEPMSVEALQECLHERHPCDDNNADEWRTAILEVLNELRRLGLAEAA